MVTKWFDRPSTRKDQNHNLIQSVDGELQSNDDKIRVKINELIIKPAVSWPFS